MLTLVNEMTFKDEREYVYSEGQSSEFKNQINSQLASFWMYDFIELRVLALWVLYPHLLLQ